MTMQSDETKIATIGKDIEYMRKDISDIKQSVKELAGVYVTKEEFNDLRVMVIELKRSSNLWKYLSPTFGAVMGSVLTFLIIEYLRNTV